MRLNLNNELAGGDGPQRARELLVGYLRRRGLRMTGEREALLRAAFAQHGGHFTLDELAREAMRLHAGASRSTVFRSLPLLVDAGILQPALVSGEARRYELALGRRHHDHLLCSRCGQIVEFRSEAIEKLQLGVAARHGFRLTSHVHELLGECAACRAGDQPHPAARLQRRGSAAGKRA